jgi:hypothetical protein
MAPSSSIAIRMTAHYGSGARRTTARPRLAVAVAAACAALMMGLGSAAAANASGWSLQRAPSPAGAQESVLEGVSCASKTACTAVGWFSKAGKRMALAERWNGTTWTIQTTASPAGAKSASFRGVSCLASSVCIAVGSWTNSTDATAPLAGRWDGRHWTVQRVPKKSGVLAGVSCRSMNACIAVGSSGRATLAQRWNGTSWTIQHMPRTKQAALNAVSCWSSTECIAVGIASGSTNTFVPLAERWNGSRWVVQPIPTPAPDSGLEGVSCWSSSACMAVGRTTPVFAGEVPVAERWNGSRWTIQRIFRPAGTRSAVLSGVSCPAKAACTAVGERNLLTLAERWNGSSWTIQRTPNPSGVRTSQLLGVSCPLHHEVHRGGLLPHRSHQSRPRGALLTRSTRRTGAGHGRRVRGATTLLSRRFLAGGPGHVERLREAGDDTSFQWPAGNVTSRRAMACTRYAWPWSTCR